MLTKRTAFQAAACLLLPWLLTGGCVVVNSRYRYVTVYNANYRPQLRVEVRGKHVAYGVPLLLTYHDSPPPYDAVFVYYTQAIREGTSLHIDKTLIRYPDGSEVDLTAEVKGPITPARNEMWYIDGHVEQRKPCLKASWTIPRCITQRGRFALVVSVTLRRGKQVLERVDATLTCEPFGETHVFSTWYWWIVSQA